jgi:hypothetical protein
MGLDIADDEVVCFGKRTGGGDQLRSGKDPAEFGLAVVSIVSPRRKSIEN